MTHHRLHILGITLLLAATAALSQGLHVRGTRNLTPRTHIDLVGDLAYTTGTNSFAIVDVSDPDDPQIMGQLAPGVATLASVTVANDYAYCAGGGSGVVIIDVSDPDSPAWVANKLLAAPAVQASAHDTLVAVATSTAVYLLGARNPASTNILDSYGRAATWVQIDGENMRIYCGSNAGAFVLEIEDGSSLSLRDQFGSAVSTPLTLASPYVNFAQNSEVQVLNANSFDLTGSYEAAGVIRALAGAANVSFVGLATGEVQYLNQQSDIPQLAGTASAATATTGLAVNPATRVVVASHSSGVTVFEYDPLSVPENIPALPGEPLLSAYPNPFNAVTTLRLGIGAPGRYRLEVTDILGRVVHSDELLLASGAEYALDFSRYAGGSYFVRWSNPAAARVMRIVYAP